MQSIATGEKSAAGAGQGGEYYSCLSVWVCVHYCVRVLTFLCACHCNQLERAKETNTVEAAGDTSRTPSPSSPPHTTTPSQATDEERDGETNET